MLKRAILAIVIGVLVLVIAPISSPVQVAHVTTGSMEPTITPSDGFVLIPGGDVHSGDVITFQSEKHGLVTHRVVNRTDAGLLTQGDANPSTDQAGGSPPVRRSRIVGKVLAVDHHPVVIPYLGAAIAFLRGHRLAVLVAGFALAAVGLVRGSGRPSRGLTRVGDILVPLFVGATVLSIVLVGLSAHTAGLSYVATDTPTGSPKTLPVGETTTQNVTVTTQTGPFTHTFIQTEGMTITNRTHKNGSLVFGVRIPPPTHTGPVETTLSVRAYPETLPKSVVARLDGIDPLAAMFGTVFAALGPLFVLYLVFYDGRTPLRSSPSRSRRRGSGLRSWFERSDHGGGERE